MPIILDTETTGTDPHRDRIVEIGAVDTDTGATFHAYYNPGIPMPDEATAVHGLTDEFLEDKPAFDSAPLLAFIGDATLVAHNAAFDVGFLAAAYGAPLPNPIIDSLALARAKHPGQPCSLDALCRRYGVPLAGRTKHGALVDAELLAAVYIELVGRQSALELSTDGITDFANLAVNQRANPLPSRITEAEIAAHAAMCETIPNAVWLRRGLPIAA